MGNSGFTALYVLAAVAFVASTGAAFALGLLRGVSRASDRVTLFADRLEQIESNDDSRNRALNEGLEMLDSSFDRAERKRASATAAAIRLEQAGGTPEAEEHADEPDNVKRARLARQVGGLSAIRR